VRAGYPSASQRRTGHRLVSHRRRGPTAFVDTNAHALSEASVSLGP
jgi:hypothetical protein